VRLRTVTFDPLFMSSFYLPEVVADARQNFASSNVSLLPPLPVPPGPQTRRSSRDRSQWPSRRALPASQVFQVEEDSSVDQSFASSSNSAQNDHHNVVLTHILPTGPREGPSCSAFSYDGPRPTRRATVLGRTPEKPRILTIDTDMTPSKRREKSKSANDLNRLIRPVSKVQFELDKRESKHVDNRLSVTYLSVLVAAKSNLSAVLDRDLFTPDPVPIDPDSSGSWNDDATAHSPGRNSLTDSPFVVHPYPSRKQAVTPAMDSPTRRDLEGVYDRLLMATSGVKRVGKGYQSSHVKPISTNISPSSSKSPGRFFHSTRRPMPPPVSSEDKFMTWTSDELGIMSSDYVNVGGPGLCEDHAGTAKAVSRALKALVTGKAVVKKASRTS
jgi:serine/threonine-protein kinase GIN4